MEFRLRRLNKEIISVNNSLNYYVWGTFFKLDKIEYQGIEYKVVSRGGVITESLFSPVELFIEAVEVDKSLDL